MILNVTSGERFLIIEIWKEQNKSWINRETLPLLILIIHITNARANNLVGETYVTLYTILEHLKQFCNSFVVY